VANQTTLADLRIRTRRAADMLKTQFVTDDELNEWINNGLSELHDILVTSFEDYYEKDFTYNVTSSQSSYPLPVDFLKAQGVDATVGGLTYSVPRYMPQQRNYYRASAALVFNGLGSLYYRIVGSEIRFIPQPTTSTIVLRYVPQYTSLVLDTDLVDQQIPNGWEDFAVADAAVQALMKEESDVTAAMARKDSIMNRITVAADSRDAGEPWRISDVASRGYILDYYE